MSKYEIRNPQESELEYVRKLLNELGYATSQATLNTQFLAYGNRADSILLVAHDGGSGLAGLVTGHLIPTIHQLGNVGRITAMVVAERVRGGGVGRELVEAVEEWFKENNCLRYEVTSGEHRAVAHRFYESLGYKSDERRFLKTP